MKQMFEKSKKEIVTSEIGIKTRIQNHLTGINFTSIFFLYIPRPKLNTA